MMQTINNTDFYLLLKKKKKKTMKLAATWLDLEIIILSKTKTSII